MNVANWIWISVTNWSTPTLLFCILNLMIGTIFIRSSLKPQKNDENHQRGSESMTSPQLFRGPSLLERVRSINFSFRRSDQPYPFPSANQHVDPDEDQEYKAEEADDVATESHQIVRSQSQPSTEVPTNRKAKKIMKKSASEKVMTLRKENEQEVEVADQRWPATVRERKGKGSAQTTTDEEDEAVDKKADDFISRFRQQLKLQRLDSILRYKEMLSRGAAE